MVYPQAADPAAGDRRPGMGQPETAAKIAGAADRDARSEIVEDHRDDHAFAHAEAGGDRIPRARDPGFRIAQRADPPGRSTGAFAACHHARDRRRRHRMKRVIGAVSAVFLSLALPAVAFAQAAMPAPAQAAVPGALDRAFGSMAGGQGSGMTMSLQLLLIMGLLTILPSLILMMTSFTRILVVLSILRQAIGLQQSPPNQVLIGLSLFLSLFIMAPTLDKRSEQHT